MSDPGLIISQATQADLPGIWAIEQTLTGPWTYGQLQEELALGHGWQWVAKQPGGEVCGYIFGSTVLDEAEVRKLAVALLCRREGIASLLLSSALQHLARQSITTCFLELRAGNLPALALYQKNNFEIVGRRKNYYANPVEDAMLLRKSFNHNKEITP